MDYRTESIVAAATPQTLTANFVDMGSEINVSNYDKMKLYVGMDINNSEDVTYKVLAKLTQGAEEEYELPSESSLAVDKAEKIVNYDVDGYQCIDFDLTGVKVIQCQVKAGTLGVSAGIVTVADAILVSAHR